MRVSKLILSHLSHRLLRGNPLRVEKPSLKLEDWEGETVEQGDIRRLNLLHRRICKRKQSVEETFSHLVHQGVLDARLGHLRPLQQVKEPLCHYLSRTALPHALVVRTLQLHERWLGQYRIRWWALRAAGLVSWH